MSDHDRLQECLALLRAIIDDASPCQTSGERTVDARLIERAAEIVSEAE